MGLILGKAVAGPSSDSDYSPPTTPNVTTGTATVATSGTDYIDGILTLGCWESSSPTGQSPLVITFSFPSDGTYYKDFFGSSANYGAHENTTDFSECTTAQKTAIREILAWYGRIINIVFVEMTETSSSHAVLRYANSSVPSSSYTYYPSSAPEGGDTWFGTAVPSNQAAVKSTYGYAVTVHEIGHGLGLKHPHDEGGGGVMDSSIDHFDNSIMSYHPYVGTGLSWGGVETYGYPTTPMRFDIAALQYMYGANTNYSDGDTTYSWDETTGQFRINGEDFGAAPGANRVFMCLWDGGGIDKIDASNYGSPSIDLTSGNWSTLDSGQVADIGGGNSAPGNVCIAYDLTIESSKT